MVRAPAKPKANEGTATAAPVPVAPWWAPLLNVAVTGVVAAVIGAASAIFVAWFTFQTTWRDLDLKYAQANRELDFKMIDVSLAILSGEKGRAEGDDEDTTAYVQSRLFALRALRDASKIAIDDNVMQNWAESGSTPIGNWAASYNPYAPMGMPGANPYGFPSSNPYAPPISSPFPFGTCPDLTALVGADVAGLFECKVPPPAAPPQ